MAVYGRWQDCAREVTQQEGFAIAFSFLEQLIAGTHPAAGWLDALPPGETRRVELNGNRVFALLQHARTKRRLDQQMEAHRRYADVQVVLHGTEVMEVAPSHALSVAHDYDPATELTLYAMPAAASRLRMRDGDCVILFPSDAHAPLLATSRPGYSRRVVVKVLLTSSPGPA